jgi:hypothetical protein
MWELRTCGSGLGCEWDMTGDALVIITFCGPFTFYKTDHGLTAHFEEVPTFSKRIY